MSQLIWTQRMRMLWFMKVENIIILQPDCTGIWANDECRFQLSETKTLSRLLSVAVAGLYFLGKRLAKDSLGITLTTRLWWKQTSWQAETGNFAAEQQDVLKKSVKKKEREIWK